MDDGGNGPGKVKNYYLQYPLNFREDETIRRLESKCGEVAPMIWLEMNAHAAGKGCRIIREEDEEWEEQLAFNLRYEGKEELIKKILEFFQKRGMIILEKGTGGEDILYFPWAERQTMSRTLDAEKQARYRERQQEKKICSTEDITKSNICYESVTEALPDGNGQVTPGNSPVTKSNKCYHNKNKNKEIDKEIDIEIEEEGGTSPDGPQGPPPIPPPKNLVALPRSDGTGWIPTPDDWGKLVDGYGADLNLTAEFVGMEAWIEQCRPGGRLRSDEPPFMFAWRWLNGSQIKKARALAQELAKERGYGVRKPGTAPADKGTEKARSQMASFAAALKSIQDEENNGGEGET